MSLGRVPNCSVDGCEAPHHPLLHAAIMAGRIMIVQGLAKRGGRRQTIKSAYCGFQCRSGVERYEKFHEPIMIEPADCRLAAKTGRFKLNGKDYPFEMNVRRSVIVNLVGGLDNNSNCEVGLFEVNVVLLKGQVATAMYEIYVRQEWARANDRPAPSSCRST